MIQFSRSLILHFYGLSFISEFLDQLKIVSDMLFDADQRDQGRSAIIVVDDAGLTKEYTEAIGKMSEFFRIPVFIIGKDVQQKILSNGCMAGLKKYFDRKTYPRGRNMGLIVSAIIGAQTAHFLDLDVCPLDDANYNIFAEHTRMLEGDNNEAVTGRYLSSDPGPLTVNFLQPKVHDEFKMLMTNCNGLGPIGQPMIGGIHAIGISTYSRIAAPHIPMTVFSDDSFLAKIIEISDKRVIDSHLEVNHRHDSKRVDYRWVFEYISERLARSIPLLPLINGAKDAIHNVVEKGIRYGTSNIRNMLEAGRKEALEKLELFSNGLKDIEQYAKVGCKAAITSASRDIIEKREKRVSEVVEGLTEYISDFLPNWQKAIREIANYNAEELKLAA